MKCLYREYSNIKLSRLFCKRILDDDKMADIDKEDDLVKRLGKLVPVYVISLFGAAGGFLDFIYPTEPLLAIIGLIIIIAVGVGLTYYFEHYRRETKSKWQLTIAIVNGILWLLMINLRFLSFEMIYEWFFRFVVTLWTFVIGAVTKTSKPPT